MRRSFVRLTLTQSAFLLGLTPAIVGFALGRALGPGCAVSSILLASWCTVALGFVAAVMALRYQLPAAALAQALLGARGGRLFGLALACAFVGWLRIHALAIEAAAGASPARAAGLLTACAAASALLVRRGNLWMARLSAVQAPALMALFAYALWRGGVAPVAALRLAPPNAAAVLLIVAAGLSDVVDMPTRLHQASSLQAALGSVACTYGVVLPAMLICGVLLGGDLAASDLVAALAAGGPAFALAVKLLLVSSATVANAGLLWSGSLSLASVFAPHPASAAPAAATSPIRLRQLRWAMAGAGLVLSFGVVGASVEAVLAVLGVALGGVGLSLQAAFVADGLRAYPQPRPAVQRAHAAAAAVAAGCGLATLLWAQLRGAHAANAIWAAVAAGVCSTFGLRVWLRKAR